MHIDYRALTLVIFAVLIVTGMEGQVIEVAAVCKGNSEKVQFNLQRLVASMLAQSAGTNIKLTLLSDKDTWPGASEIVSKVIGQHLTRGLLHGHRNIAVISVEYADLDDLVSNRIDRNLITSMKRVFGPANKTLLLTAEDPRRQSYFPYLEPGIAVEIAVPNNFDLDLFYIAPFYHRLFMDQENLIVVDLDLEFMVGLDQVHRLFSTMTDKHVVAFVPDQSPYYPFTTGATQTPRQGVNSGLVLYKLDNMRKSREYNEELTAERMESLSGRYLPNHDWNLAEQDWFSLLSWEKAHLVKLLPCQFNVFRCHWSHILSSPMWKNLPCNEEPAILHHCGIHE